MNGKIIIVTGANRGIGFEIVRQLAHRGAQVTLTARSPTAGQDAVAKLKAEGLAVGFYALDVTNQEHISKLQQGFQASPGKLDVLINNAGILSDEDTDVLEVDPATVRSTLETNTLAPLRLTQALAPLLQKSDAGRIVNVSSGMGAVSDRAADHAAYRLSKTGLNGLTAMLASAFAARNIAVNAVCPGWVRTDMGGPNAHRDVTQGAETPVWLALDAPQSLTGNFIRDKKVIPW